MNNSIDSLLNELVSLSHRKQTPTLYFDAIANWFDKTQKTLFKNYVASELENSVEEFVFDIKINNVQIKDGNLKSETQQIIERATSKAKKETRLIFSTLMDKLLDYSRNNKEILEDGTLFKIVKASVSQLTI
jgi:hypothetical protein